MTTKNNEMIFSRYILIYALLVPKIEAIAQVDFATKLVIDNVVLYQDSKIKTDFYYAPYGLQLVKNDEGKPDFMFIQMRYTGTKMAENQGSYRFKSILRFKVANLVPSKTKRDSIKEVVRKKGMSLTNLRPLPIHNLRAVLIHTVEKDSTIDKEYSNGFFESNDKASANSYWTERDFTLRLNNEDAQLFWTTFHNYQPTLSVNYTFFSKGLNSAEGELSVSGSEGFTEAMKARFNRQRDSINKSLDEKIVVSGTLSVTIDAKKWPELLKQIDINERIPPEYAALDVYCFDFNNDIREDLYAKSVEIIATGVGSRDISFKTMFRVTEPDIYAKTIKFIYAVKPDEPYSYRITEIFKDGKRNRSDWQKVENWHQILDITSKPQNNSN